MSLHRWLRVGRARYRDNLADRVDKVWHLLGEDPAFITLWKSVWPHLQWDHMPTARRLFMLAKVPLGEGTIVEIGSFLGNSTIFLAGPGTEVHAIDPHSEESMTQVPGDASISHQFLNNLERFGVRDKVTYHRATSTEVAARWSGPKVRLLFIDGLHTYDAVLEDYRSWAPHLAHPHVVVFDDFLWPEVEQAVRHLVAEVGPVWWGVRGGQAMFSSRRLPLRWAGLP